MNNLFPFLVQNLSFLISTKHTKLVVLLFLSFAELSEAQTWVKLPPPIAGTILGTHFVNDQTGYICGANGAISKTVDCGKTWQSQISGTTSTLYSIFFTNNVNDGVAVGDGGALRITTDAGQTWKKPTSVPPSAASTDFRVVWFDTKANIGYIGGGVSGVYSQILKTIDGGDNWTDISPAQTFGTGATGRAIYGIYFRNPNVGYATDFDGRILKTIDAGINWNPTQATSVSNNLHGIYFTSDSTGFAVGGNSTTGTGVILKTENAGGKWIPTTLALPAGSFLTDVKFHSSGKAYAVGGNPVTNANGVIYKPIDITTPGMNSWGLETTGLSSFSRLFRLSIPSANTVYTVGLNGTVLKTPFIDATFTVSSLANGGCFGFLFNNTGSSTLTYSWDFNDPLSGTNNTSALQNATHIFSKCGTFNVCLTVTGGGCSTTTCQTITIVDTTPPVIVCPPTYAATCSSNAAPATAGTATATDDCTPSADIMITYKDIVTGLADCDQTIKRTWTAKDKCGNTSTCEQLISVRDNIPPMITNCPQNQTVGTDPGQCFYTISNPWVILATDNCDPSPSVSLTYTDPAGVVKPFTAATVLPKGINTFVYVAKDKCRNMSKQCAFTITVIDKEAPKIICPPSISVIGILTPAPAQCKAVVNGLAPSVTDNCPMVTVAYSISGATTGSGITDVSGTSFMQGISTVTYTATDMGGNTASCSFTVTVKCDTCKCGTFSNMYFRPAKGIMNLSVKCSDTLNVDCKPIFDPIVVGVFECMGTNCPDSAAVKWTLNSPSGPLLGTGNLYAKPGFSVALLGSYFNMPGIYQLTFIGKCNGKECTPCKFYIKVPKSNLNTGLTGYFPFNGNANDVSPSLINGVTSNVTQTPAFNGLPSAFSFNGTNSWIDAGTSNRGVTDAVSVCAWVKTTENAKGMWVAGQYLSGVQPKGYLLAIGNVANSNIGLASFSGRVDISVYYIATSISSIKVNDGKWHCLVGTAGNGEWRIYVDGILRGSQPGLTTPSIALPASSSPPFTIGTAITGSNPIWYNGDIDDVRVYNRVLNECEIEALCTNNIVSGLGEVKMSMQLSIYPNPNSGSFSVELPEPATSKMTFRIADMTGSLVLEQLSEAGNIKQTIQAENLPSGMYFLQLVEKGRIVGVQKFVKQ